tara:strand:- start:22 stop:234 length:213 start_codon:yes stop_codon:yes gene_type:complete
VSNINGQPLSSINHFAAVLAGIPFLTPLQASIHAALLDSFSSRHATGPLLLLDSAKLDKEVKVTLLQLLV